MTELAWTVDILVMYNFYACLLATCPNSISDLRCFFLKKKKKILITPKQLLRGAMRSRREAQVDSSGPQVNLRPLRELCTGS